MTNESLVDGLREARANYIRDDYADAVKALVAEELGRLEPNADIEDTLYFNHSAIPDFVLTWPGERRRREFFVRASYASIIANDDTNRRLSGDPVFLSLDSTQAFEEPGFTINPTDVVASAAKAPNTLVTDASAVSEISRPSADPNPLADVVKDNFIRGGRGLIDAPTAEKLVDVPALLANDDVSDLIRAKFFEDAVVRMERTATLVQWASSTTEERQAQSLASLVGTLSADEVRRVLPWILRRDALPTESAFWRALGAMMSLARLEEIGDQLEGVDVTALIRYNADNWEARRAYLGLALPNDDGDYEDPSWRFRNGFLSLNINARALRVSSSGNKLKSRPAEATPRWTGVKERLEGKRLQTVSLSGIERSVTVEAHQHADVLEDIERVTDSMSDDYFTDSVKIAVPTSNDDESGDQLVLVEFAASLASTPSGVALSDLTRIGFEVLAPIDDTEKSTLAGLISSPDVDIV